MRELSEVFPDQKATNLAAYEEAEMHFDAQALGRLQSLATTLDIEHRFRFIKTPDSLGMHAVNWANDIMQVTSINPMDRNHLDAAYPIYTKDGNSRLLHIEAVPDEERLICTASMRNSHEQAVVCLPLVETAIRPSTLQADLFDRQNHHTELQPFERISFYYTAYIRALRIPLQHLVKVLNIEADLRERAA